MNGWQGVEPLTNGFYVNEIAHDDPANEVRATYVATTIGWSR